jgi:hypothetical protein
VKPPARTSSIAGRALLLADLATELLGQPSALVPLLGKPLLLRAVERLVAHGCKEILVLLGEHAGEVRSLLGNGERWGCRLAYHYLDPRMHLSRQLRALGVLAADRYWLADASRVPVEPLPDANDQSAPGRLLCWQDDGRPQWSGWGSLPGTWLLAQDAAPAQVLEADRLLADPTLAISPISAPLAASSPLALLDSTRRLLAAGDIAVRMHPGPGSQVDAEAQLIPPLHLGRGVKIGAGAIVGPNAVVEDGAFIDRDTHLCNSIVLPETYVGPELDLDGVVAGPGLLANTRLDTVTEVHDTDLLSTLVPAAGNVPFATRALAGLLRIGLSPAYLWLRGYGTPVREIALPCPRTGNCEPVKMLAALELPAPLYGKAARDWAHHFCRSFYPGLRHVMRGELRLIGPSLRGLRDVRQLPDEWRRLYGSSRCGLLNEGLLLDAAAGSDEDFASDALAAAQFERTATAVSLVLRYLQKIHTAIRQQGHASHSASADLHPEDAA